MNELIKELADTAHKQAYEIYTERLSKEKADRVIFYDIFNQKFAELIVKECMSLVSEPGPDMNDTERGILAQIKQHFGVEE